jgi:NAD(P)H-flavin reductase
VIGNAPCAERAFRAGALLDRADLDAANFRLALAWDGPAPRPGQFFMLKPGRGSAFLGRPISVYRASPGRVEFLVTERGAGTRELRALAVGESVDLTGPLGNWWPLPPTDSAAPRPIALISGGIGVAPLAALAFELAAGGYDFYAGYRSASFGLEGLTPRDLVVASEDGCEGCRGRIPDLLDPGRYAAVYACGPLPMLKAVAAKAAAAGVRCLVSLEARMACGVGACLGCTVRTTAGNRRCCADGPVFDAREVLFDE